MPSKSMKPAYIRFAKLDENTIYARSIDVDEKGEVIIDFAENGTILGVEILSSKYIIEINGRQVYPVKRKK